MAAIPKWHRELMGKVFIEEAHYELLRITEIDDPEFAIAEDTKGNQVYMPWQQIESGYFQRQY